MTKALHDAGLALEAADTLVRMPKGFEDLGGTPVAPAIRLKSYIVRRQIPIATVQSPALVAAIVDLAAAALPLLQFGWAAVDEARG